ncbi:MAG: MBL fold metallo-hydrolase [Armatimonadetes bacterium]|nr:MBL fold metallo-hydrolase [Anaerolineae bacterium]
MVNNNNRLSRRDLFKAAGAGALTLGVGGYMAPFAKPVRAQADTPVASAFYRFNVGDFSVTAIQDVLFPLDYAIFGANAPEGAITALLEANNIPVTDAAFTTVTTLLVNTGDELVLLDTGNGVAGGGRSLATLELLGITPDQINAVVLSHFHPDHINGVSDGAAITYPNATYYMPQTEWDFVQNAPAGTPLDGIIEAAKTLFAPIVAADQLAFYASDAEIVAGIQAVAAPGHTPGHHALLIQSGSSQLLNMVDTALSAIVSLQHPEWYAGFDADGETASATRRAILERASSETLQVFGYHFPFPGIGFIDTQGGGFRFVQTNY